MGKQDTRGLPGRSERGHSVKGETGPGKAERREGIPWRRKTDLKVHRGGVEAGLRSWGCKAPGPQTINQTLSGVPHMPFHLKVAETHDPTPPSQGDTTPPHLHPGPLGAVVKGCQGGSPAHLGPEGAPLSRPQPSVRRGGLWRGFPLWFPSLT